jgi:hypothetical protein
MLMQYHQDQAALSRDKSSGLGRHFLGFVLLGCIRRWIRFVHAT